MHYDEGATEVDYTYRTYAPHLGHELSQPTLNSSFVARASSMKFEKISFHIETHLIAEPTFTV
jgi:hypothetical protein